MSINFWSNVKPVYSLIDDTVKVSDLQEYLRENNSFHDIVDNDSAWIAFTQYYGEKHGLNETEVVSFTYLISVFMCNKPLTKGEPEYYDEDKILDNALEKYVLLRDDSELMEQEKIIGLFNYILELYKTQLKEYTIPKHELVLELTDSEYQRFLNVPGENKKSKFRTLLYSEHELNIARMYICCPQIYLKDVDDLKEFALSVFDEIDYCPDMEYLDWAIQFVSEKDYSPEDYYPVASVLVEVYCLIENYNL